MKPKLLNISLLLSAQFGYMEWGGNQRSWLFEAEAAIVVKAMHDIQFALHPLILIPFTGLIILVSTLFQKHPGFKPTLAGMICLATLLLFLFVIGCMALNIIMILSTIPFILTSALILKNRSLYRTNRRT
jgi:hypothetical protein